MTDSYPDFRAAMDQLAATMSEFPPVVAQYYGALREARFDHDSALDLTRDFQDFLFSMTRGGDE